MSAHVRLSGSWSNVSDIYARVGGSWKEVAEGYVKLSGAWKQFFSAGTPLTVNYLVIAGGGGASEVGGGAGGYRTSAGTSGGGASAESALTLAVATNYTVTVGGGGSASTNQSIAGTNGSNSIFSTITATGGGGGGPRSGSGSSGGSGGGGGRIFVSGSTSGGAGTANQGYAGGGGVTANNGSGGGGGGAGAVGQTGNADGTGGGNGGNGVASSITGTSVTRGGGGGACYTGASGTSGLGGSGGGGRGEDVSIAATPGTVNTGGGGGGTAGGSSNGAGGSGVVILKYPDFYAISVSAGLTHSTVTSGGFRVTTFTAGTGTVSFSEAVDSDYVLIGTTYLTSSQASVTFDLTGLSGTYKHLQLRVVARTNRADVGDDIILRFNNDSTVANYRYHALYGTGSVAGSENSQTASGARFMQATGNNFTASAFNVGVCDILDPFSTTNNKTIKTLSGVPGSYDRIWLASNLWASTASVTSITLVSGFSASFVSGTRFSIYGIKG